MAEIGGMLAAAALKMAAGKMAEAAGDRIMLQWTFSEDLEDMEDTMESIQAVLEDAEGQSIMNASVRLWLKRLTRASNHISDVFDEFEVKKTRKSALQKFKVLNPCLKLAPEVGMVSKMKKVREKLEKISNHHHKFSFTAGSSSSVQQVIDERVTSSEVIEANIVGRDNEKRELMELLTRPNTAQEVIIVPIYGIGGMGKTTLAQLLFNDTHFKDYGKAWVYIGQSFDLERIKCSIESKLQMDQDQVPNTQELGVDPSASKKILIVLDDLWEKNETNLDSLKDYLNRIRNGHKLHIIITTRDGDIAKKIKTTEAHKIAALSTDVCWNIIKQIAGFRDKDEADKGKLENIGKEIAKKCGGVALAARALGYTLRSRNYDGWVLVKDSGIWNASTSGYTSLPYDNDNVLASLKLSYSSMLPHLRLCFACCAIFPKGCKMAKDDLIFMWAALGFVKQSEEVSIWQHGEICIKQLLDMSFFQHSESPSSDRKNVALFTMHDLVHDLARSAMGDELLDASEQRKFGGRNCRYAFLEDCSKPLNSFLLCPDKIRALRFLRSGETGHCSSGFSAAKYLRVLDFGECSLKKLPSSIGRLKMLRLYGD
ncbi:hypothetical protein QOZ80_9AG0684150 [Eleusine coracana subsp. coracana]|nr:hypothetical protein QOZ80_9AG0684150 [Eleusine coracana subsp. coracana]